MQRVYKENEWGKVSKRIITICMATTIIVAPWSSSSRGSRWCVLSLWYDLFSLSSFLLFLLYVYSHLTCFPLYLSLVFATTVYLLALNLLIYLYHYLYLCYLSYIILALLFYLWAHSIESQECWLYLCRQTCN